MDLSKEKPTNITPEMAKKFLATMRVQRPVRAQRVISYAAMMARDAWQPYPAIEFNDKGEMVNGQHRCEAIVLCGLTVQIYVVRGIDVTAQRVMDIGLKRGLTQQLLMYRPALTYVTNRCAAVHVCAYLLSGQSIAIHNIEEYDRWYSLFREGLDWAIPSVGCERLTRTSPVVGALAFAYKTDPERIEEFGQQLITGERLKEGDPAHTLRKYLATRGVSGGSQRPPITRRVLNAAEAFVLGDRLSKMSVADHGRAYFLEVYADVKKAQTLLAPWQTAFTAPEASELSDPTSSAPLGV